LGCLTGPAAAGVAEFFGRRAFVTMAGAARPVLVLFSTRAGVQGRVVIIIDWYIAGLLLCIFWHVFTIRTVVVL
jgi:hypothetical protein